MFIEFIIIAILQGFFEWLPISSTGQVFIVSMDVFGFTPDQAYSLGIWLHLGTTLAVLLKFRKDYIKICKSIFPKFFTVADVDVKKRNWIIYATLGTAITGIPLYIIFMIIISNAYVPLQGDVITLIISGLLIVTGLILLRSRKNYGENTIESIPSTNIAKDSFLTGLIQGTSILPGISRSGVTVTTILLEKYNQDNALKLSFLMIVPVAFASIGVDILFGGAQVLTILTPISVMITTVISFLVGYLTIELLLRVAKKINFGYFCIIYGVIAYIVIIPFIIVA